MFLPQGRTKKQFEMNENILKAQHGTTFVHELHVASVDSVTSPQVELSSVMN